MRRDNAVLLAIDHTQEVAEPISDKLRELGVRSLREALKEPESVAGAGDVVLAGEEALVCFNALESSRFRKTFRKRLNELGVDHGLVRRDWQDRLDSIQEIRFGETVEMRFRFRGKLYVQNSDSGFDRDTGIFWMKKGLGHRGLYKSVAKQLIFKPMARPIDLVALECAVELEVADPSFGRPGGHQLGADDDDVAATESYGQGQECGENDGLGEVATGHSPIEPDPERNRPNPRPISTTPEGRHGRIGLKPDSSVSSEGGGSRPTPAIERTHISALKHEHYASHCQMCLCESTPQRLAPAGSYIEPEEVRRSVVEAHHADLVAAGGARHAGNIILLCKLHHKNFGSQLTRAGITAALRGNTKEMSVSFDKDSHVKGRQIEMVISGTGEVVKLFFTEYHMEYWLSPEAGAS